MSITKRSAARLVAIGSFCGGMAATGLALSAAGLVGAAPAQPGVPEDHPLAWVHQVTPEESMDRYLAASTLNSAHAWLGRFVGTWATTMTVTMGDQTVVSQGSTEFSWLFEGRFLQQTFSGEMMGMPFQGFGIQGFDNVKRQYTAVWMDSMGTGMLTMQGSMDRTGRVLTMAGAMDEVGTGEHGKISLWITTWIDDNHFRFEAKEILYGDPFVVFTIDYTRAD